MLDSVKRIERKKKGETPVDETTPPCAPTPRSTSRSLEDDALRRPALPRLLVSDQQGRPSRDLEDLLDTLTRSTGAFHVMLGADLGSDGLSLQRSFETGNVSVRAASTL